MEESNFFKGVVDAQKSDVITRMQQNSANENIEEEKEDNRGLK